LTKPLTRGVTLAAAGASQSNARLAAGGVHPTYRQLWALAAATLVLGLAYTPSFRELWITWFRDANYSHGILVIPVALVILHQQLASVERDVGAATASWIGWLLLAVVMVIRGMAYELNLQWTESLTLLPALACLTWVFGGWPLLRRVWPAIAFLVFMFPLPPSINNLVLLPLQRIATAGSCFLLQLSGLWSVQEGNVIHLKTPHGMEPLDVALACSGLRMLMMLAATVTATIILIPLPAWQRITLLLSTIPIALLTNIIRIAATGWCYYKDWNRQWAHDWSGLLLLMPLGLVLVFVELAVLSWLVPAGHDPDEDETPILPTMLDQGKSTKKPGRPIAEV
jgi:exosortase